MILKTDTEIICLPLLEMRVSLKLNAKALV